MRVFLVAGEASADRHAADLVRELHKSKKEFEFLGVGGTHLQKHMEILVKSEAFNLVGLADWIDKFPSVLRSYRQLVTEIKMRPPSMAILLDLPDLNLLLARHLKQMGVPIIYYISPQVWAWRKYRLKKIKKLVNLMLVLFPFEKEFYASQGVPSKFVGHPAADRIRPRNSFRMADEIRRAPRIALLPGSRPSEIKFHSEILNNVIDGLRERYPAVEFRIPVASTLPVEMLMDYFPSLKGNLVRECEDVLNWSDVALVASGTATLETALTETPFCLFYRVSSSSIWIFRTFAKYKGFIGLPNVLLRKELVREFLQESATARNILCEMERLIEEENYRKHITQGLRGCRALLGSSGASRRAADQVLEFLGTMKSV